MFDALLGATGGHAALAWDVPHAFLVDLMAGLALFDKGLLQYPNTTCGCVLGSVLTAGPSRFPATVAVPLATGTGKVDG